METPFTVEQTSPAGPFRAEFRITVRDTVRCYYTGTREAAEAEAKRIVAGIEMDAVLMQLPGALARQMADAHDAARFRCPTCGVGRGRWCDHRVAVR